MENATLKVKDGKLTIVIDLKSPGRPSKSGKTLVIAGSGGFAKIEGCDASINLNVTVKNPDYHG